MRCTQQVGTRTHRVVMSPSILCCALGSAPSTQYSRLYNTHEVRTVKSNSYYVNWKRSASCGLQALTQPCRFSSVWSHVHACVSLSRCPCSVDWLCWMSCWLRFEQFPLLAVTRKKLSVASLPNLTRNPFQHDVMVPINTGGKV